VASVVNNRDRNFTCGKLQRRMEEVESSIKRVLRLMGSDSLMAAMEA
jgi:hypothetical protein